MRLSFIESDCANDVNARPTRINCSHKPQTKAVKTQILDESTAPWWLVVTYSSSCVWRPTHIMVFRSSPTLNFRRSAAPRLPNTQRWFDIENGRLQREVRIWRNETWDMVLTTRRLVLFRNWCPKPYQLTMVALVHFEQPARDAAVLKEVQLYVQLMIFSGWEM